MCITEYNEKSFVDGIRAEGRTEGRAEVIENMLRKGMTPEEIAQMCEIDLEEVKKVEEALLASAK